MWFPGRPAAPSTTVSWPGSQAAAASVQPGPAVVQRASSTSTGERRPRRCTGPTSAAAAAEHGFPFRGAQATIFGGWALASGATAPELRAGLAGYLATGAELEVPYYLGLLAEVLAATPEGLAVAEEALGWSGPAAVLLPGRAAPHPRRPPGRGGTGRPGGRGLRPGHGARRRPRQQVGRAAGGPAPLPLPTAPRPRPTVPACGGSTTSSRRGSAPPTWWPPGRCWRAASPSPPARPASCPEVTVTAAQTVVSPGSTAGPRGGLGGQQAHLGGRPGVAGARP